MELLEGIESRTSALKLTEPGPSRAHLDKIISAAVAAPDHGRLRPWRFIVLEGDARKRLADAMADMLLAKLPDAAAEQLAGERAKPMRAPTIIVVAATITRGKIPEIEQILAAGAAAQNIMLAAHALGYGSMWKTGGIAYDANAKTLFGLKAEDHIIGLMYLGTTATPGPKVPAPIANVVKWL